MRFDVNWQLLFIVVWVAVSSTGCFIEGPYIHEDAGSGTESEGNSDTDTDGDSDSDDETNGDRENEANDDPETDNDNNGSDSEGCGCELAGNRGKAHSILYLLLN